MTITRASLFGVTADELPVRDATGGTRVFDPESAWRFLEPALFVRALQGGALASVSSMLVGPSVAHAWTRSGCAPLAALRALWIEDAVVPLEACAPSLDTLVIECLADGSRINGALAEAPLRAPSLRSLTIDTWGLSNATLQWLAAAVAPSLEALHLGLGASEFGADHRADALGPLLSGALFPALRELGLHYADINRVHGSLLHTLSRAPLLDRLTALDLRACWFEGTQRELDLSAHRELEVYWDSAWPGPGDSLRYIPSIE